LDLAVGLGVIVQTGSTYQLPDGTKLGYYSKWKNDQDLWDNTIVPGIEEKIGLEWKYGNKNNDYTPDEVVEDDSV